MIFKVKGIFVYTVKKRSGAIADEPGWEDEWWVNEYSDYTVTVKADSLEEAIAKGVLEIKKKGENAYRNREGGFQGIEIVSVYDEVYGKRKLGYIDVEKLVREYLSLLEEEKLSRLISSILSKK
jgi:hypothetical protein